PVVGRVTPVTRLNSVVLPAPLGPISAVRLPSATSKDAPATARTPPKLTPSSRMASAVIVPPQPWHADAAADCQEGQRERAGTRRPAPRPRPAPCRRREPVLRAAAR